MENQTEYITEENIDLKNVPGYFAIPENLPDWKKYHLERKNREAINSFLKQKEEQEREKQKYGDIPQWKKNLLLKKEKEIIEKANESQFDKFGNIPQWKKDLLNRKQQQISSNN